MFFSNDEFSADFYEDPCYRIHFNASKSNSSEVGDDDTVVRCNATWDSISCWPDTPAGRLASLPCPSYLVGIPIDFSANGTRFCNENGTWQTKADYSKCLPLSMPELTDPSSEWNTIYCAGFLVSMAALTISLVIFLRFKNLRCMRNTIHCHLILSFILRMVVWLLIYFVVPSMEYESERSIMRSFCKAIVGLFNYAQATNFFWMLMEGLYLHTMIVCPFAAARVRLWHYALVGWGVPLVIISTWVAYKARTDDDICWLPRHSGSYEYLLVVPILCVLFVNLLILANIVRVLVTKLRESKSLQTVQYRIAVKSTLVLLPLLGLTYLFFLIDPSGDPIVRKAIALINAFLQSTQGFFVSLFYCFLNGEVRSTIKSWLKNARNDHKVGTVASGTVCCLLCRDQGGIGGGGGGGGPGGLGHRRPVGASSVTELTKPDIEIQMQRRSLALI